MSWSKLLSDRSVTDEPLSKAELDNLRSIVGAHFPHDVQIDHRSGELT